MKKHPLDIIILICLIIVIFLLVFLLLSVRDSGFKKDNKNVAETEEKMNNIDNMGGSFDTSNNINDNNESLFNDTKIAASEDEVVYYISQVEQQVEKLSHQQSDSKKIKDQLEDTFITFTDFIFYGGTIKGITFQELTDMAKEKVLIIYEKVDSIIESRFPSYKENIKSTAKKSYTTVISKASELKDTIVSKYKEKVGDDQYNNVVDNLEEDKNRFQDAYTPYIEKGKEIGSQTLDKGKEIVSDAIGKIDSWYNGFKESRE